MLNKITTSNKIINTCILTGLFTVADIANKFSNEVGEVQARCPNPYSVAYNPNYKNILAPKIESSLKAIDGIDYKIFRNDLICPSPMIGYKIMQRDELILVFNANVNGMPVEKVIDLVTKLTENLIPPNLFMDNDKAEMENLNTVNQRIFEFESKLKQIPGLDYSNHSQNAGEPQSIFKININGVLILAVDLNTPVMFFPETEILEIVKIVLAANRK